MTWKYSKLGKMLVKYVHALCNMIYCHNKCRFSINYIAIYLLRLEFVQEYTFVGIIQLYRVVQKCYNLSDF